ncbi:MAG TPA: YfhO family protein, partial [Acidimicrobiales bacterium]|nr:YfhO family protein [Acidimicrobiales bacterium]
MTSTTVADATTDDEGNGPEPGPRHRVLASERRLTLLALACVVGVVALTMGSSLIGLRTLTVPDLLSVQEPWRSQQPQDWTFAGTWFGDQVNVMLPDTAEFVDRLWDGDFPSWSPYNNGGTPFGAIDDVAVFSPTTWPYMILPLWLAPAWSQLVVTLVTIAGMALFLRRLGVSRLAGIVAGLAFATSGFMYVWTNWPQTRTAAFLPWMFWAVERAVQRRRASSVVPIAVITALVYVGYFPAVAAYIFGSGVLYGGYRLVALRRDGVDGRELRRIGGLGLAAIALGLGLVAWLILPFTDYLGGLDLGYREQTTQCHAPARSLGSLVFPRYGSATDFDFACPTGEHETEAFAGAMVVGLAVVGLFAPGRGRRGLRTFFLALAAVTGMLAYLGGPGLWLVQQFPVFDENRIMRIRVLMSFALAVLAAFGVERLRAEVDTPERRRLLAGVAGLMAVGALLTWRIHDWPDIPSPPLHGWIPVAACVAAAAVFLAARAPHTALRVGAVALVPLLVGAEAVGAIRPYWPTGDPDDLYAESSTTDFLSEHLGHERFVSTDYTLQPSANRVYGLRALTGRTFYEDTWGDLLEAINGGRAGLRSLSLVPYLPVERVQSPVLDRLAVRYYVTDAANPIYGEARDLRQPGGGRTELRPDEPVTIPLEGPVRAVGLDLPVPPNTGGERPRVEVELLDADGHVLATGSQRLFRWLQSGPWHVPVPGDGAPTTVAARLTLVDADRPLVVREYGGSPAAYLVLPEADGLRLVHAEGTAIYERTTALPRIRWASEAIVEPDARRRLELLADPEVPASTVVLSGPGPRPSGRSADVEVVEDSGDAIRARVDADGDGYLVVADAIQRGWRAEVDGEAAELRAADHGVVAVAVPAGTHEVRLAYVPPGQRTGIWIAVLSALVLVGLALTAVRR